MKPYTKTYFAYFGYTTACFVPCEICGNKAVGIHHIEARGAGGNPLKDKDKIENLQAVCRACHIEYGDVPELKEKLKEIHLKFMKVNGR